LLPTNSTGEVWLGGAAAAGDAKAAPTAQAQAAIRIANVFLADALTYEGASALQRRDRNRWISSGYSRR
jgi:hypothetical protein